MADQNNNDTSNEAINLSGTEDLLISDQNGQYRERLLKQLMDEATRLKALTDKGSTPEAFEQNTTMMIALLAAADAIEHTWKKHHTKKS